MKTFTKFLYAFMALGMLGIFSNTASAQCAFNNDPWTSATAPTSVGQVRTISTCFFGGEYSAISGMVQGSVYRINTCGDFSFDTELTIFNSNNTSVPVAYNDDFCGAQSQIDFTPSSSGTYYVQVNEAPGCGTRSSCMTIRIELLQAAPPPPQVCTTILPIPYTQDFESFSTCGTSCGTACALSGGWTNSSFDGMDWTVDAFGTSSSGTGPQGSDFLPGTSSGKYLYTETSGSSCNNTTADLISPCFILSGALCPAASFGYHQYGSSQGTLSFDISLDQGNTWLNLWSSTGDQGSAWQAALVDLTPYAGTLARFRLRAQTGSSFTSDMAIDGFRVFDQAGSLNASFTGLPSTVAVNGGAQTLTPASPGGTFSGTGVSGNTFDPFVAGVGTHVVTYQVGTGLCTQSSSQIVTVTPIVCTTTNSLPYNENFDSFSSCSGSCGSACTLSNGWTNEVVGDDFDWTTDAFGTSSFSTGPSGDHTSGSGNYLYTETSGSACNNATAIATSPCIDLGNASCPVATVWYHQYGSAQGTFNIDISSDNGNTWSNIFSSSGDQGDQWNVAFLDLTAYSGVIRLRMRGETGSSFTSDMAFDDVEVFDFAGANASFTGLPSSACTSDGPSTLVPAVGGGSFSGPGVTGNTFDPVAAGPGTHTVTYSVGPAQCASTNSQTVTVLPPPVVNISGNNAFCEGGSTVLTAASPNCPNGFSAIYDITQTTEITSTGQNMNFSFANAPNASGSVALSFTVIGDFGSSFEYADLFDENGNNVVRNSGAGFDCSTPGNTINLSISATQWNAWAADGSVDFLVDLSSGVNSFCSTEEVTLAVNYSYGQQTSCTISWSDDQNNALGTSASISVSPTQTTTYTATVTDGNGCVTSEDYVVTVYPTPFVDAGEDQTICEGESATLTVNGGGGPQGANSLTTTFNDNNSSGGNMFDVVAATSVEITGFDANFTSTTNTVEIYYKSGSYLGFENNASAWTFVGSATVTGNGRGTPTAVPIPLSVNIPAGQTYSFYIHTTSGGIAYTNGTSEGAVYASDGNISVLEGIGRSTSTSAFTASIFRPRVVNTNVYYNTAGQSNPGNSYLWSTGATTQSISVSPGVGSTTYSVTLTDGNGCSNVDQVTVNVNPNPDFTWTVTDVSCFGGSDGAIDLNIVGQTLGAPYSVSLPFQNMVTTGQNFTFNFTGATAATGPGTLTVGYTGDINSFGEDYDIFDENGNLLGSTPVGGSFATQCDGIIKNFNIPVSAAQINQWAADGTISFVADASTSVNAICTLEGVEMSLTYAGGPAFSVAWTGPNGYTSTMEDISGLVAGTYVATVTDVQTGCSETASIVVNEPPLLVAEAGPCATVFPGYSGPGSDLCEELNGSATGGTPPYSYSWSSGDNSQSSTVCPTTTTLYTVTVTDANGCTATDTVRVFAYDVTAVCRTNGNPDKIEICHVPPGNPGNAQTICVDDRAGEAHLIGSNSSGHDNCYLGPCGYDPCAGSSKGSLASEGMAVEMQVNAYPNPFSTYTTIQFTASVSDNVTLEVFTLKGEKVATLFDGEVEGRVSNSVKFYANDLSDGIYMYKLTTGSGEMFIDKLVINR